MDKALQTAYKLVMNIEPLGPAASAGDKRIFGESVAKVHHLVGLMHEHVSGVMTADAIEEEQEDVPDTTIVEKGEVTPEARVDNVWERFGDGDAIDASDWLQSLLEPSKLTLMEAEQDGFARLLAGYEPAERIEHIDVKLNLYGHHDRYMQRSIEIEVNPDLMVRIQERERLMVTTQYADALFSFNMSVLRSIHAIRFSSEWAKLSTAQKSQARKDTYYSGDIKGLTTFMSRHNRVIKARNDLRKLFAKFGARVLMDPAWAPTVSYDTNKTGRSVTFPATLKIFLSQVDMEGVNLQTDEDALMQLLGRVMPPEMVVYVGDFLGEPR